MARKAANNVKYDKNNGIWKVEKDKSKRASKTFKTKNEAIDFGTKLSKKEKTELVIFNKDGKISNKNSFGNDPNPPKDKKH